MSESFEDARIFAQAILADCDIPLLDRMKMAHESEIAELQRTYEQKVIDLQTAHEREMEAIRKRLSVLMSKSASLTKSAEIAKSDADDGGEVRRITDELRNFVADRMTRSTMYVTLPDVEPKTQLTEEGYKLIAIADHMDEQFERICEQQETVLQSTIEHYESALRDTIERMAEENLMVKDERDYLRRQRDELQAKLDAIRWVLDGR